MKGLLALILLSLIFNTLEVLSSTIRFFKPIIYSLIGSLLNYIYSLKSKIYTEHRCEKERIYRHIVLLFLVFIPFRCFCRFFLHSLGYLFLFPIINIPISYVMLKSLNVLWDKEFNKFIYITSISLSFILTSLSIWCNFNEYFLWLIPVDYIIICFIELFNFTKYNYSLSNVFSFNFNPHNVQEVNSNDTDMDSPDSNGMYDNITVASNNNRLRNNILPREEEEVTINNRNIESPVPMVSPDVRSESDSVISRITRRSFRGSNSPFLGSMASHSVQNRVGTPSLPQYTPSPQFFIPERISISSSPDIINNISTSPLGGPEVVEITQPSVSMGIENLNHINAKLDEHFSKNSPMKNVLRKIISGHFSSSMPRTGFIHGPLVGNQEFSMENKMWIYILAVQFIDHSLNDNVRGLSDNYSLRKELYQDTNSLISAIDSISIQSTPKLKSTHDDHYLFCNESNIKHNIKVRDLVVGQLGSQAMHLLTLKKGTLTERFKVLDYTKLLDQ